MYFFINDVFDKEHFYRVLFYGHYIYSALNSSYIMFRHYFSAFNSLLIHLLGFPKLVYIYKVYMCVRPVALHYRWTLSAGMASASSGKPPCGVFGLMLFPQESPPFVPSNLLSAY